MSERMLMITESERAVWREYYRAAATGVIVGRAPAEPAEVARMSADFADALLKEERRRHPNRDWDSEKGGDLA